MLATHASFDNPQAVPASWSLRPTFNTRRLVRWSLGVDGDSRYQRDHSGKTVGGSRHQNLWAAVTDQLSPPAKRPKPMLRQWATDLTRLLGEIKPSPADTLLVNTGDDFAMLALAAALKQADIGPLRIDVIFHFALYESDQTDRNERLHQLGRQIRSAVEALRPHDRSHPRNDRFTRRTNARDRLRNPHQLDPLSDSSPQRGFGRNVATAESRSCRFAKSREGQGSDRRFAVRCRRNAAQERALSNVDADACPTLAERWFPSHFTPTTNVL